MVSRHALLYFCLVGALQGGAAVPAAPTELLALLLGWCTICLVGAPFAWLVHLRQVHPLKAPPERLLNEYLLHLAVSRANDVQTLLELRKFNAVNSEECCCALSYGCSVDAGLWLWSFLAEY